MITIRLQAAMLAAILLYFFLIGALLAKKRLHVKYTLLWLAFGAVMLIFAIFPDLLGYFARMIGFQVPANGLFAVLIFCILVILMSLTAIVSKLNDKCKRLIQSLALLEKRVRDMEKTMDNEPKQ